MPDYFALLDEPRRPWIDPASLKSKFLTLSARVHPDRFHTAAEREKQAAHQRYLELNTAYNVLRQPKERLRHLLELESGTKPKDTQRIPHDLADLFVEVGQLCRDIDGFLVERSKITSPLLKVQMFERAQSWTEKLSQLRSRLGVKLDELNAELERMNPDWVSVPMIGSSDRAELLPLERLEQVYRVFSYFTRWANQIQERLVRLTW
ncbi:MAG: hypothetical protein DMF60_19720 [Acidobacteria bacterium]|nr:MAG: hypothetical protein DMF60_19720 [Acidobacteriota bacterium]